jgi:GT2 family glycosyltransferase
LIDLTIVIVSYETRELLSRCLACVAEACAFDSTLVVETIVVDNGSRDKSVECARTSDLAPRIVALAQNLGFAAAANRGLRLRRGRHVLLLNTDVEMDPSMLCRGVAILDERDAAGVLGAALRHPSGRRQRSVHALPDLVSELVPEPILRWWRPEMIAGKREMGSVEAAMKPRVVEAVRGAVFFIRGELLEKVGLLDEGYFFFLEETDYCWRVQAAGYDVLHCDSLRAIHGLGASSKRRVPLATRIEFHRSLYRYLDRRCRRGVSGAARIVRVTRTMTGLLGLLCVAAFSSTARQRMTERMGLLLWHLRGRPREEGLAAALLADGARFDVAGATEVANVEDVMECGDVA